MVIEKFLRDRLHPDLVKRLNFGSFAKHVQSGRLPNGAIGDYRFRREVRAKYNNECSNCGSDKELEAHHIKPVVYVKGRMLPYQDNSVENGLLLCDACHKDAHRVGV